MFRVFDWSPDARSLVLNAATPSTARGGGGAGVPGLWIYTVDNGTSRRLTDGTEATWMRDGRRLICGNQGRLSVVDASSGRALELPLGVGVLNPRLAADDSQLLFLRTTNSADIWVARFGAPAKTQ